MSFPQQTTRRKRNTHQRRNAYHAMPSPEVQAAQDAIIAARLVELIMNGQYVEAQNVGQEGARELLISLTHPTVFVGLLMRKTWHKEYIDADLIREHFPVAYDAWVSNLTDEQKRFYLIGTCDEKALRKRCREAEQARFAERPSKRALPSCERAKREWN